MTNFERSLRTLRWWLAVTTIAVLSCVSWVSSARADETDDAEARRLFRDGVALHASGNRVAALAKFRAAYARWKNPKILPNIGTTAWELGRNVEAADAYDVYLATAPPDAPDRTTVAKARALVLKKVATLSIEVVGEPSTVTVDRAPVSKRSWRAVRVKPGDHVVTAIAETGTPQSMHVEGVEGETVRVVLRVPTENPRNGLTVDSTSSTERQERPLVPWYRSEALPWVLIGTGGVALGASAAFYVVRTHAIGELEHTCFDSRCPPASQGTIDRANSFGVLGAVTGLAGTLTAFGGLALYATSSDREVLNPQTSLRVTPVAGTEGAGIFATGRF